MKYSPSSDNSLLYGKNQFIYRTEETDDRIDIFLKSSVHSCKCPLCGTESSDLHATYERTLQDVPIRCKSTYVHVNVFKYNCNAAKKYLWSRCPLHPLPRFGQIP